VRRAREVAAAGGAGDPWTEPETHGFASSPHEFESKKHGFGSYSCRSGSKRHGSVPKRHGSGPNPHGFAGKARGFGSNSYVSGQIDMGLSQNHARLKSENGALRRCQSVNGVVGTIMFWPHFSVGFLKPAIIL
jgi:hypothetical protein